MRKIAVLLGLCQPLAELFLGKRNAIIERLNILAECYMGTVEILLPQQAIAFRFPLTLLDVGDQKFTGLITFYLREGYGWRCKFDDTHNPARQSTAGAFRYYEKKFDKRTEGQHLADMFAIYTKDQTPGLHLEFRECNLEWVRVGPAFLALEDHFLTLTKELES